jgi:methyl-accepting chemotaxis protein
MGDHFSRPPFQPRKYHGCTIRGQEASNFFASVAGHQITKTIKEVTGAVPAIVNLSREIARNKAKNTASSFVCDNRLVSELQLIEASAGGEGALDGVSDTVGDIADTAGDLADTAGDLAETVGDAAETVGDAVDTLEGVADTVGDAQEMIDGMAEVAENTDGGGGGELVAMTINKVRHMLEQVGGLGSVTEMRVRHGLAALAGVREADEKELSGLRREQGTAT